MSNTNNRQYIESRVGKINHNKHGLRMKIIKYKNAHDISVKFDDYDITIETDYQRFKMGSVLCGFEKSVLGVGYLGEVYCKEAGAYKNLKSYLNWLNMMKRCYDKKTQAKHSSYKNCEVAEKWHSFHNFSKWHKENYYHIENEKLHLDKDILLKGNRVYSPETCIYVPSIINSLFIKSSAIRGAYPIGVSFDKGKKRYEAYTQFRKKRIHIGYYFTPEEAFEAYKEEKEKIIKSIADEYKEKIPEKLYIALYDYKVEITD